MWSIFLAVIAAYLLGSIPNGFLIGRARGVDIRTVGSKNIGATNVFRTLGKPLGIFCFLLDALKGWLAVYIAVLINNGVVIGPDLAGILGAIFGILGHNFTPWLGFKGGKGIATSAGALISLVPWITLIILAVWAVVFFSTRYVSLASICASASLFLAALIQKMAFSGISWWMVAFTAIAAALAIWRHQANIQRLLAGTENRFTRKSSS